MTPLLAKAKSHIHHPGLELPSIALTSWEPDKTSLSPTGAVGQHEDVVCWAAKGTGSRDGTGRAGVGAQCWSLLVAWQGQEHEAAQPRVLQTRGKPKGTKHVCKIFFP